MEFVYFLIKAKQKTYASGGEGGELKLDDGSRELIFEEGEWAYRDRYFGSNPFLGEEVVWRDEKIFWGMNYYGGIIDSTADAKQLYDFLKKALKQVAANQPFRGLDGFTDGQWSYNVDNQGSVENFSGEEKIYFGGKVVYNLIFHGGSIK